MQFWRILIWFHFWFLKKKVQNDLHTVYPNCANCQPGHVVNCPGHVVNRGILSSRAHCQRGILSRGMLSPRQVVSGGVLLRGILSWVILSQGHIVLRHIVLGHHAPPLEISSNCGLIQPNWGCLTFAIEPFVMDLGKINHWNLLFFLSVFGSSIYLLWFLKHDCRACNYLKLWTQVGFNPHFDPKGNRVNSPKFRVMLSN